MSSPSRGQLAVAGCCLVATLAYSGAVTTRALAVFVIPAVFLVSLVSLSLTRRTSAAAAGIASALLALGLAEIVNIVSGEQSGPVARSSFFAAISTAVAVSYADRWSPISVCVPVTAVLGGALFLGAAGEVIPVVAVLAVLLTLSVPLLEAARRRPARSLRTAWMTPLLAIVAGVVAFGTSQLAPALQDRAPKVFGVAQADPRIKPLHPISTASPAAPLTATVADAHTGGGGRSGPVTLIVITVAAAAMGLLLLRLGIVALAWKRLRRRLRRGSPAQRAVGAWSWAVLRLRSYGVFVPPSLSPDQFSGHTSRLQLSDAVWEPLRTTARWATDAAFSPRPEEAVTDSREAWEAAERVAAVCRGELPRWKRATAALRSVPGH
jgi:hypothetical protein